MEYGCEILAHKIKEFIDFKNINLYLYNKKYLLGIFMKIIYQIFSIKKEEIFPLVCATLFIFLLFYSYGMLRPIRDSLGISNFKDSLKWLFLGTFIATIFASLVMMALSSFVKKKNYFWFIYGFFACNLLGFYFAFSIINTDSSAFKILASVFYIWVSVFSLFIISIAWSLIADIFSKERSIRLFGIITAGASLGAICGAFSIGFLSQFFSTKTFILFSFFLLLCAIFVKQLLLYFASNLFSVEENLIFHNRLNHPVGSKNPLSGVSLIFKSKYLLAIVVFILLLSSVSTFLYMEQARVIKENFHTIEARASAFGYLDLIVQSFSLIIQIFLTSKIAKFLGLKPLLSLLGFIVCIGFIVLIFSHPAFLPLAIVMSIRRIGEYAFIKPAREMLFVPLMPDEKYKVKNFLDTVVYRGGDAASAQVEGLAARVSIDFALLVGAIISFIWGSVGFYLAKKYQNKISDNNLSYNLDKVSKE